MSLRTFTNKDGVVYDAENTEILYAEDMNALTEYVDPSASKTAPVDADNIILTDSEASSVRKKLTWAYIKSVLKTYFDGIYAVGTIPVKASGSEIDTGTDDAKFATAKAIADSALTTTTELNTRTSYKKAEVVLSDGATPALDASLGDVFTLSAGGNRTIAVPSNPVAGQKIIIRHYASGGARTLALNTGTNGFRFGSDITALTETASGKTDYIGCVWNSVDSKWDVVAYVKGF